MLFFFLFGRGGHAIMENSETCYCGILVHLDNISEHDKRSIHKYNCVSNIIHLLPRDGVGR